MTYDALITWRLIRSRNFNFAYYYCYFIVAPFHYLAGRLLYQATVADLWVIRQSVCPGSLGSDPAGGFQEEENRRG